MDVDGRNVFSKATLKRHAQPGEIVANIGQGYEFDGKTEQPREPYH